MMSVRIAIDTGGTFTDLVFSATNTDRLVFHKVPSTPEDPSTALVQGIMEIIKIAGVQNEDVQLLIHGTTVATNTILQRKGARAALITTAGFRDILEFRRGMKDDTFNWRVDFPNPLSPRHMRMEVPERIVHTGEVLTPLDEAAARAAVRTLKKKGVEAIAVCFLFSFLHPAHEQRVGEIIREEMPDAFISLSCQVSPQVREYERISTTALDAYIGPRLKQYLTSLDGSLREIGFQGTFLIMQSNGGGQSWREAISRPVTCISSGPAASVPAAIAVGEGAGKKNLLSVDMGGTSCDVVYIEDQKINKSLESLSRNCLLLRVLGSYPRKA